MSEDIKLFLYSFLFTAELFMFIVLVDFIMY